MAEIAFGGAPRQPHRKDQLICSRWKHANLQRQVMRDGGSNIVGQTAELADLLCNRLFLIGPDYFFFLGKSRLGEQQEDEENSCVLHDHRIQQPAGVGGCGAMVGMVWGILGLLLAGFMRRLRTQLRITCPEARLSAPAVFRPIHGLICIAFQLRGILAICRIHRHPDARGRDHLVALDCDGVF